MPNYIDSATNAAQLANYNPLKVGTKLQPENAGPANPSVADNADKVSIKDNLFRSANLNLDVNGDEQPPAEESSTNTNLEYRRRQATVLKIRTQEGDVVKLKFRNVEKTSIQAGEQVDGETVVSNLEIASSSRTRLLISVKGDINDAELAAIQSVAEQASQLAGAFFGGNINDAFQAASNFAIDGSELARVSLRLSVRERLSFAQTAVTNAPVVAAPPPVDAGDDSTPPAQTQSVVPKVVSTTNSAAAPTTTRTDVPLPAAPSSTTTTAPADDAEPPVVDEPSQPSNLLDAFQALADVLNRIAGFLENLLGNLGAAEDADTEAPAETSSSVFDFRFRLDFFAAVVKTTIEDNVVVDETSSSEEQQGVELLTDTLAAITQDVDPQSVSEVA